MKSGIKWGGGGEKFRDFFGWHNQTVGRRAFPPKATNRPKIGENKSYFANFPLISPSLSLISLADIRCFMNIEQLLSVDFLPWIFSLVYLLEIFVSNFAIKFQATLCIFFGEQCEQKAIRDTFEIQESYPRLKKVVQNLTFSIQINLSTWPFIL